MANLLEQKAEQLKKQYPRQYHRIIDHNLKWVSAEMDLKQGSVDISEGLIAMTTDLPALLQLPLPKPRVYKRSGTKRMSKR